MMLVLVAVIALGFADVGLTAYGMQLGIFEEANPVIASLLHVSPAAAFALTVGIPLLGIVVIWSLRNRTRYAKPAMWGLFAVRVVVLGLHIPWLLTL